MSTPLILEEILTRKRSEVAAAKKRVSVAGLRDESLWDEPRRGFRSAIASNEGRSIIAEIKKASPSRGVIREDFDPVTHAAQYAAAGARCISVLTDEHYFQGSLDYLRDVRMGETQIPLLRKDFTVDSYQIFEARAYGADAILLIVAALSETEIGELSSVAAEEGLDVLVEVHDEDELDVALRVGATLVGVNNRNLRNFETSINTTRVLIPRVPEEVTLISESGFRHPHELAQLESLGVDGFLIGESLMKEPDPGVALEFFMGRAPKPE